MKIIFATHNPGKVKEVGALLAGLNIEVVSAEEAGVIEEAVEDGKTFEENALKKARFVAEKTGEWSMADDSGICIDALGGEPGVYSARYAGAGASAEKLINFVLEKMKDVLEEKRPATFFTVAVLISPAGEQWAFEGKVSGRVASSPRGAPRPKLPYDVVFIPEGGSRTFAEMADEEKNRISHRARAFLKLKDFLTEKLKR